MQLLKSVTPQATDILVSFDVINMFTNIPVDEALEVIGEELQKDDTLASRSCMQWDAIMEILKRIWTVGPNHKRVVNVSEPAGRLK